MKGDLRKDFKSKIVNQSSRFGIQKNNE